MLYNIILANEPIPNTLPAIFLGAIIGIALAVLLGWGIAALLGASFGFRFGWLLLAGLLGLVGSVTGDACAAHKRPLDAWERETARRAFGASLDVSKVRIAVGCRLMNWPRRNMNRTPFQTIYLVRKYFRPEGKLECMKYEDVLVHELTHCWQTQHRIPFRKKLGTALRVVINRKKPYQYGYLGEAWRARKVFRDFNTEQQAAIITHGYCCKYHTIREDKLGFCPCDEHYAQQMKISDGFAVPDSIPEH